MTTKDILQEIYNHREYDKNILYKLLIEKFEKEKIDFIMFDEFGYIYKETEEKEIRRDQDTFRKELIERYKKCIITNAIEEICEACHIIPHSICEEKDKYNVNNGILLRSDFHKLFDKGLLNIDFENSIIILSQKIMQDENMIDYHKYQNKKINIHKNSIFYFQNNNKN